MKKQLVFMTIRLILFVVFVVLYLTPRKYETHYLINDYMITERYDNGYLFKITKDKDEYKYHIDAKYIPSRKIIDTIDTYQETKYRCIFLEIKKIDTQPLCYEDTQLIDFRLINTESFKKFLLNKYQDNTIEINKKIGQTTVYNYDESIYLIWDYNDLIYINQDETKIIQLFDHDQYENKLVTQINNLLFIPNYDQKHSFNEIIVVNLINGETKKWEIEQNISFDSRILGILEQDIYLVDIKEEKEYRINLSKNNIELISSADGLGLIYNKKWEDVPLTKIINQEMKFNYPEPLNKYVIEDNKIFFKEKTTNNTYLISRLNKAKIIKEFNEQIYYFSEDTVYSYHQKFGEIKLLSNYEWKFDFDNRLFIYKK